MTGAKRGKMCNRRQAREIRVKKITIGSRDVTSSSLGDRTFKIIAILDDFLEPCKIDCSSKRKLKFLRHFDRKNVSRGKCVLDVSQ